MKEKPSEELPLIEREAEKSGPSICAKSTEYAVCLLVAFPTAVLNGLAAVSGDSDKAGSLHTPGDLKTLLGEASIERIVYGVIALTASEAVLFFLNKRYLLASSKAAVDLVRRTIFTLRRVCCCNDLKEQDRARFGENSLFVWSLVTSLIFAEMGGKALSFLGMAGEIVGFSLSLSVYFATRFAGAKIFFANITDANYRLKQYYLSRLDLLQHNSLDIQVDIVGEKGEQFALMQFLDKMDAKWETLPKDTKRIVWLRYVAPIMGYTLVAITALPVMSGFLPESVQGAEMLTYLDLDRNSHYQNILSFGFGTFATALTLFFYELNIKDLPKHFFRTALSIYEHMKNGELSSAMKLFGLTLLAFGASYLTGIGFKFVADTALSNGYLSYLGGWLSRAVPDGLFTAVIAMLWSHLQGLISQTSEKQLTGGLADITHINITNASAILAQSDTDISALSGNRYTLFHQESIQTTNVVARPCCFDMC